MEISPVLQSQLLLWCAVLGVCIGVLWELFSAVISFFAEHGRKAKILQFVFDFYTVVSAGFLLLVLCYYFNKGEVRFFAFAGFFAALAVFKIFVGKAVKHLFCAILRIMHGIICAILKPLVEIFKYSVNKLQKIIYFIRKVLEKCGSLVYNIYIRKTMLKKSKSAFLGKRSR